MLSLGDGELNYEDKELIVIVDEKNQIIGPSIRREMRLKNLIHRATYIFVIQKQSNKFFVQKRSSTKRYCPSYFEPCFGGVVAFDETYDSNAQKEIKEEAGLKEINLSSDEEFYFENEASKAWGKIYYGYYDGDVTSLIPQPEEVEFIQLMSKEEIINSKEKWTPDGLIAFNILSKKLK